MAFTSAQASAIRFVLGYPDLHRYRNTRLEAAIEVVGNDADASARVIALLTEIATINGSTYFANLLGMAGLKKADEVEWYPWTQGGASAPTAAAVHRGRMLCAQVSIIFGVPIANDIFSTAGYTSGDGWMGRVNQYGVFPLG